MSGGQWVGALMIAAFFIGLFAVVARTDGWRAAGFVFAFTTVCGAFCYVASWLLSGGAS